MMFIAQLYDCSDIHCYGSRSRKEPANPGIWNILEVDALKKSGSAFFRWICMEGTNGARGCVVLLVGMLDSQYRGYRFLPLLCPLANSAMMSILTVHCQWEDEIVKKSIGHPPSYAKAKKMKSLKAYLLTSSISDFLEIKFLRCLPFLMETSYS